MTNYNNKIIELVCECCYPITTRDFIGTVIYELYNMDKTTSFYKVMKKEDKIIVANYNIKVSFKGKSYDIPVLIQFPKEFPKTAPEIYIENKPDIGINTKNTDIDSNTRRINTLTLRSWNIYSNIKGVIDDLQTSFNKEFPIYKITNISKPPPIVNQNQFNDMSSSKVNQDFSLFSETNNQPLNSNIYNNQFNNNFNQSYINNTQQYNNPYYSNSNPNVVGNFSNFNKPTNNTINNPNTFYSSSFNNNSTFQNNFNREGNNYGNNQIYNNNNNSNWIPSNQIVNPQTQNKNQFNKGLIEQEIKKKLIDDLKISLEAKIKDEIMSIKKQEDVLNNFKKEFLQFNENLSNSLDNKFKVESLVNDFVTNIKDEVAGLRDHISMNEKNEIRLDNYYNFIQCKDMELIRFCAVEATIEDFISIIKKSIEKGIYDFQSALKIIREVTKEIIKVRFCRDKLQRRYGYISK